MKSDFMRDRSTEDLSIMNRTNPWQVRCNPSLIIRLKSFNLNAQRTVSRCRKIMIHGFYRSNEHRGLIVRLTTTSESELRDSILLHCQYTINDSAGHPPPAQAHWQEVSVRLSFRQRLDQSSHRTRRCRLFVPWPAENGMKQYTTMRATRRLGT